MEKKTEVSYNPQLGYVQTIFQHKFDFLREVKSYAEEDGGACFTVGTHREQTATVHIQFAGENAVRFRMIPPSCEDAFDNAVFQPEVEKKVSVVDNGSQIVLSCGKTEVQVQKFPWEVSYFYEGKLKTKEQIYDSNVDNMCKNLPIGFTMDENGTVTSVNETMYLYSDEEFYGFGEKFTDFGKRGQTIHCWQTDALSTNTEQSYKNHPYFMSSRGYAVLLNTYTRSKFEMGSFSNVAYNMSVDDKVLDYMVWMGEDYKSLLQSYLAQMGEVPMIPKWAFGLWMSKCSYMNQEEIYDVVEKAKEHQIKMDVIHIDGWQEPENSGAWVWDRKRFPDPEGMIRHLKENGIRLSLWIFPYINENSKYFEEAAKKGYLIKNQKGEPCRFYATATSDTKVGCFDFTNPEFLAWYRPRVQEVVKMGIGVVKTDFSEAVPEDAVYFDGSNGIQGHNKLTYLYAQTIYDAMQEVKAPLGEHAMLWGRSGFAGSHTIPAAWAGDSSTHLNNHACILRGGLSAAMSGIPFWGFDMGGFYNTNEKGNECLPTEEEYIRSCEFGFLNSLSRCHGKTPREPWNFSKETEDIFRSFDNLRHSLLPYLYSTAMQAHLYSIPMIRPVIMEYPKDRNAREVELEYFLGDNLLIAPVFDQDELEVFLPEGIWTDWFTGERISGGRWITAEKRIDRIPVYQKAGTIIPCLTEIPADIDTKYQNLRVRVNIDSEINAVVYEDAAYHFKARMDGEKLIVDTDLDLAEMEIYAGEEIAEVVVNGVETEVVRGRKTLWKRA